MCTGIQLAAKDGSIIYGRTMEWGTFDLESRVSVFPRNFEFQGHTGENQDGKKWKTKYGFVCLDALKKDIAADGMNEEGLCAGMFYHPRYASYQKLNENNKAQTISSTDIVQYILSNFKTVEEVKAGLQEIDIVGQFEPSIGFELQVHTFVVDASGKSIVIEFRDEKTIVFDNHVGVITNAPHFDWHVQNLNNYLYLKPQPLGKVKLRDIELSPFGGGSGFLGVPGDFTPPSRFVRAALFTNTARETKDGPDTVLETFRILDNFNVPLGASEGVVNETSGLISSTLWTTAWDTKNHTLYYHTEWNRQIKRLEFKDLDFTKTENIVFPLEVKKEESFEDILKR